MDWCWAKIPNGITPWGTMQKILRSRERYAHNPNKSKLRNQSKNSRKENPCHSYILVSSVGSSTTSRLAESQRALSFGRRMQLNRPDILQMQIFVLIPWSWASEKCDCKILQRVFSWISQKFSGKDVRNHYQNLSSCCLHGEWLRVVMMLPHRLFAFPRGTIVYATHSHQVTASNLLHVLLMLKKETDLAKFRKVRKESTKTIKVVNCPAIFLCNSKTLSLKLAMMKRLWT